MADELKTRVKTTFRPSTCLRLAIIFSLAMIFIRQVGLALYCVLEARVALTRTYETETELVYPSITICPFVRKNETEVLGLDKMESLEQLESVMSTVQSIVSNASHGIPFSTTYESTDISPWRLSADGNESSVWSSVVYGSIYMTTAAPGRCAVLNPNFISSAGYNGITLTLNFDTNLMYDILVHDRDEYARTHSYDQRADVVSVSHKLHAGRIIAYEAKRSKFNLIPNEDDCQEADKRVAFVACYEDFIDRKVGCVLPWRKNQTDPSLRLRPCSGKEDMKRYLGLVNDELWKLTPAQLENVTGCKRSCSYIEYRLRTAYELEDSPTNREEITLTFYVLEEKVSVTTEVLLYTWRDMVADVGGYLGLLLGISAITVYDVVANAIAEATDWYKGKRNKRTVLADREMDEKQHGEPGDSE